MKVFNIIATSVLGTAMAIGTGFALANKQNMKQAKADATTFDISLFQGKGTATSGSAMSETSNGMTISFDKGYGSGAADVRSYAGGNITFSADFTFTTITITATDTADNRTGGTWTVNSGGGSVSKSSKVITWTGSTNSLSLNNGSQLRIASLTFDTSGGTDPDPSTEHAGTAADPYSVADAIAATPASGTLDNKYVKGYIVGTPEINTSFGNATFDIADTKGGSPTFNIYRTKDISGAKITDSNRVKENDLVVVCGSLYNYNGTKKQMTNGNLVSVQEAELEYTDISWFYTDSHITSTASGPYKYKGTVIGIVGNSYYLQQGSYGIMVYGGSTTPPTGMKVGDLVEVTSKVINYNSYLMESNGTPTASILGTGTLPAATIVTTLSAFNAVNQSTYVTFNGLKLKGSSFAWDQEPTDSKDGIATVQDGSGNDVTLFLSRFADDKANIIDVLEDLVSTDTFDVAKGVKAIAAGGASAGQSQLSLFDSHNITIHHAGADLVQDWIDEYMFMDDASFDGNGTGKCISDNLYITAKRALVALGSENVTKFSTNEGSKYTAALARYNEWARINGDTKPFEGNEIVRAQLNIYGTNSNVIVIALVASTIIAISFAGVLISIRKRKHQ